MKGTVVMRFVGNRQEPEESLRPEAEFVWPTDTAKQIDEFYKEMRKAMFESLKSTSSSSASVINVL